MEPGMEIHCGNDHRGYELKRQVIAHLAAQGHSVHDHGCSEGERVDYPRYAHLVAEAVTASPGSIGIVICGSGVGVSIAANKIAGVRCVAAWCEHVAEYARRHNHANVLAFAADLQTFTQVERCLAAFFGAEPEGGRHADRVAMLER
jgi:ribose 5-phosphate isomerase B